MRLRPEIFIHKSLREAFSCLTIAFNTAHSPKEGGNHLRIVDFFTVSRRGVTVVSSGPTQQSNCLRIDLTSYVM